jgi:hypothetical protein
MFKGDALFKQGVVALVSFIRLAGVGSALLS